MKYWTLEDINKSNFDKLGLVPRSITKIFNKFKKELDPNAEIETIEEFRISRYLTVSSTKYLLLLILVPIIIGQLSKSLIVGPCVDYCWNHYKPNIFLNSSQQERAFAELEQFEEKIHFEILIGKRNDIDYSLVEQQIRMKAIELAQQYSNESANAIKNIVSEMCSITAFMGLLIIGQKQISILKSFINEVIYGLSDTAKAFLIILFTDIFVGFHSPHGWEVIIESMLRHFGLPESRDFIFLFISTFPVILDTIFKYWIFRYLNRVSPSAVATYHNMNE
uniref:Potassium/proton antiporter CemA n=1 Tax=Boldia erythrosiphon TaxID=74908 RepID=A0A1Y9TLR9_9RHOD|nr:heme binding protein cemA [Boldia erythrosiphon]ARO90561.1 heme binding protein cemA [Boldia erythrosiphon]